MISVARDVFEVLKFHRFSTFCEKNEENLLSRSSFFLRNASLNSAHLTSSFSSAAV